MQAQRYVLQIEMTDERYPLWRVIHEIADRVEASSPYGSVIVNGQALGRFELQGPEIPGQLAL